MLLKSISSTAIKNNFGQVLEDINARRSRYVVERHGIPKAVILSLEDFLDLLHSEADRVDIESVLREIRPTYEIGRILDSKLEET